MAEYIEREAAKLCIFEYGVKHRDNASIASACENLERQINFIPSADVIEVVRCKDCDMAKPTSDEREMYCTFDHCYKGKNYFCADGRRKNENPN